MIGERVIAYTISSNAAKMIKSGLAEISSGGVRDIATKQLVELAKPAVKNMAGDILSPLSLVSGVANNVQSAMVQKGVNQVNKKVDLSLDKLDQVQRAVGNLSNVNALGWLNCTIGIVNCGISLVEFAVVLKSLNKIEKRLDSIEYKIDQETRKNVRDAFHKYSYYIISDVEKLKSDELNESILFDVSDHLCEISAFLGGKISDFEEGKIDSSLAFDILFPLGSAFAKELKAFSALYYYEKGEMSPVYDLSFKVVQRMADQQFSSTFKNRLLIDFTDFSFEDKYLVYNSTMLTTETQIGELIHSENVIQKLDKNDYMHLEAFLHKKIMEGDYQEIGDHICILI
ncbi:MAG: hypothetical protein LUD12_11365 [Lachnospiraceae bacterium]|nr:hypothetical protein [Lachnospiraceae bacterium]